MIKTLTNMFTNKELNNALIHRKKCHKEFVATAQRVNGFIKAVVEEKQREESTLH